MPRLAPVRRRTFVRVIESNGLQRLPGRGKGSHEFYQHPEDEGRSVTVPGYDVIDPDLLAMMIREAGKDREEYPRVPQRVK